MKDVKVTELRRNLKYYVARVKRGERIRVTCRGKVVAEIMASAGPRKAAAEARNRLRGSVLRYVRPLDPVFGPEEWEMQR